MLGTKGGLPTARLSTRSTYLRSFSSWLGRRDAGGVALLGNADRAERRRVYLIDKSARGENDFGAAAADVGDGDFAARDVERPLHAQERQPGLFVGGNHFDVEVELAADALAKLGAVLGVADGAGGDGRDAADAIAVGDREKAAERGDRGFDGGVAQLAGGHERGGQPSVFAFFVEDAVAARGEHLGHDQPDAIRADVDRGDAGGRAGVPASAVCSESTMTSAHNRPNRESLPDYTSGTGAPRVAAIPFGPNIRLRRRFVKGKMWLYSTSARTWSIVRKVRHMTDGGTIHRMRAG